MNKQTITIRRVGSVALGIVLVVTGTLLLIHVFYPQLDFFMIYRFWPVVLIVLGIEVLAGSRYKNYQVLDETGKIVEQCKTVYDFPAVLMMAVVICFGLFIAFGYRDVTW